MGLVRQYDPRYIGTMGISFTLDEITEALIALQKRIEEDDPNCYDDIIWINYNVFYVDVDGVRTVGVDTKLGSIQEILLNYTDLQERIQEGAQIYYETKQKSKKGRGNN